jgi:starch phosphorylase
MRTIRSYNVVPSLPQRLSALKDIVYNLWWTWNLEARRLFMRMGEEEWEAVGHNPVAMLGVLPQKRLDQLAAEDGFLIHLDRVKGSLDEYLSAKTWYDQAVGDKPRSTIAYFSAEFGLHECLPIYSGGLGLLAGDHLKAASGLGLPLTGVGLFYYNGYFRQYLNADGWQQEFYHPNDCYNLPCVLVRDSRGEPVRIAVEYPKRTVYAQILQVNVGRVQLFLLDANIPENRPEDRAITDQLYGGDHAHRLDQEILLGIGGYRALRALGREPNVCHMNEGHSAFSALERIRVLVEERGWSFEQAREAVSAGNIFTTHTPVPAGNDEFHPDMIEPYFKPWYRVFGLDRKSFMALGRQNPHNENEPFGLTVLALKTAGYRNGVSELHGSVSRAMWQRVWPDVPVQEVPIGHITNGVHIRSYVSDQLDEICIRYLGPHWTYDGALETDWAGSEKIPDAEMWRVHERRRGRLVTWARQRLRNQFQRRGATKKELDEAEEVFDPEALTLGFARRFATYKRATLLFRDPDRLARILNDRERPVQLIFAGKAHPRDHQGKEFIQTIIRFAREDQFRRRVIFLEDYDITVARYMVQGVDVWLNTPRRPLEASGTSGMKAAANGVPNCSILDGWWVEGYNNLNGWAIGQGEEYSDLNYQDEVESRALYDLLERRIVPLFYERSGDENLPRGWVQVMKQSMKTAVAHYSTARMVRDYTEKYYFKSGEKIRALTADNGTAARALWEWKVNLFQKWAQVRVEEVLMDRTRDLPVGAKENVRVRVHLGPISPDHVLVQLYSAPLKEHGVIGVGRSLNLTVDKKEGDSGVYAYRGHLPTEQTGRFGFEVRVLPHHDLLTCPFVPGLITWG